MSEKKNKDEAIDFRNTEIITAVICVVGPILIGLLTLLIAIITNTPS